jgi:hypothetical protein
VTAPRAPRKPKGPRNLFYQLGYIPGENEPMQFGDSIELKATNKKAAIKEIAAAAAVPANVKGYQGATVRISSHVALLKIASETTTKVVIK